MVLKLSELMQYVLYEAKDDTISLRSELKYIESYLELEKLRFTDRLKYNIEISGSIENVYVPPLIFLPFIENCFKHGVSVNNSNINIIIKFDATGKMLIFEVENPIPEIVDKRFRQVNEGIGLKNVRKRLKLNYQNKCKLDIISKNNTFKVSLTIPKNK